MHLRILFVFATALAAVSTFGQTNELGIFANGASYRSASDAVIIPGFPQPVYTATVRTNGTTGYGVSFRHQVTAAVSLELSAQRLKMNPGVTVAGPSITVRNGSGSLGTAFLDDFDAAVQWHFAKRSTFDPYIGGGLAWVAGNQLDRSHVQLIEPQTGPVNLDDKLTWLAETGADLRLSQTTALLLQVRYLNYSSSFGRGANDAVRRVGLDPLSVSLGLRWKI